MLYETKHLAAYFGCTPKALRRKLRERNLRVGSGNRHGYDAPAYAFLIKALEEQGLKPAEGAPEDCRPPKVKPEKAYAAARAHPVLAGWLVDDAPMFSTPEPQRPKPRRKAARHPRPPELEGVSTREVVDRYVARFSERKPDWAAFEDAKIDGYKRAQHRFIGAGGSGKHGDPDAIPARAHTLSIMYVEPGQGNAPHTHEVEETFFVLQGFLDAFVEDEGGANRVTVRLSKWDCITCPPGVIHGYDNNSLEPVWFQVMLGRGRPETMGYADTELYERRNAHLED